MGVFDDARRARQKMEAEMERRGEIADSFPDGDDHEERVKRHKEINDMIASRKAELFSAMEISQEEMEKKAIELINRTWDGEK